MNLLTWLIVGLVAGTGLLLYWIFHLPRIPVKLIVIILVVGLGGAWAVLKSIFARPAKGSFGIPKTAEQCPRIYQVLTEVAGRVDTEPVHEVYLAPGSSIGVHQEGRGPFGIFGVSRRVLTLGVSTLRFLTIGENMRRLPAGVQIFLDSQVGKDTAILRHETDAEARASL